MDAFATYLAFQSLIDNFDDIDGPGNNSYLWWAQPSDQMTVVAWDHNLAFGLTPGGGGKGAPGQQSGTSGQPGGAAPTDLPSGAPTPGAQGTPPDRSDQGGEAGQRGPGGKSNVLVTRFNNLAGGTEATAAAKKTLTERLIDSGTGKQVLQSWVTLLTDQAGSLIAADTSTEAAQISKYLG